MNSRRSSSDSLAGVYNALSTSRRCHVIRLLAQSDGTLDVRELAREIAAIEEGIPVECASGEPYRNVYNALAQTHLSTLSEADIIIYDSNRQTVAPGPHLDIAALIITLNRAAYRALHDSTNMDERSIGH